MSNVSITVPIERLAGSDAQVGRSFNYTAGSQVGLVHGEQAAPASTRGVVHAAGPLA